MLQKFSLNEDFSKFYNENGYVILRDLFPKNELERVRQDVFDLFDTRFSDNNKDGLSGYELLVRHYGTDIWRQCAKRMWDLVSVLGLAANPNVNEVLRKIDLRKPLISTRPEIRTDMPKDQKYRQPWHQDWRYAQGSYNAATFWIPLQKVTIENGTIDIIPKSHLLGLLGTEELQNPRRFSITDPRIEKMPYFPVELEIAECVAFSQMLVHRSGENVTKSPRLSAQLRYTDYSESSFITQGYPVASSSELIWKDLPSENDMERIYKAHNK
jgi:ectoine hydroxylase-related dioxygenase (phytanoyl-CoA dioxygenase family)